MGFIFISYSRQDTQTVDQIVSRLKKDGFDVWIDRTNIKGGDLWTVAIVEAIDTADSFVLMLSPSATVSDNVRKEVQLAQDAKRRLFPLLIMAVTLPAQFRYQLAGVQMIDYAGNPETKYRELVEVLQAQRDSLSRVELSDTRQVEVVLNDEKISDFNARKQDRLLNFLSGITETPRSRLRLVKLRAGSVHALIMMPRRAAYVLKTAALNRDQRLVNHGMDAMRLDGEENYVLIDSGEISPLNPPKRKSSFFARFLPLLLLLGILAALVYALFPRFQSLKEASPAIGPRTRTPNSVPPLLVTTAPRTRTPLPPRTFTPASPEISVPITPGIDAAPIPVSTSAPPVVPKNEPPSEPIVGVDPIQPTGNVSCYDFPTLFWDAYDADGISMYQVIINAYNNSTGAWENVFNDFVQFNKMDISDIVSKYCQTWISAQVSAQDALREWGPLSKEFQFYTELPPPP